MAAYTENWAELRWGGGAWADQETWSCGLKLKHIGGDALAPMLADAQATVEDCAAVIEDYFSGDSGHSGGLRLEWVRLNPIDRTTGKYAFPNEPILYEYETPVQSPLNAGFPQVAYCVTMRGVPKRGPAARGRWYVPCTSPNPSVTGTGVMAANIAQAWANAAGTFLRALQDIESGEGPNTWSPHLYGQSETAPSVDSGIVSVSVGNVFDTQRRRRAQIEETYYPAATW